MKFCDLPIETQQRLNCERLNLHNRSINSAYEVLLYNQPGTRYFHARRHQNSWSDDKGNYMPFGGGSEWTLQYGCCLLYTSPSPRDSTSSRMPSSA